MYNIRRVKNIFCKLTFEWLGLYKIFDIVKDKDIYIFQKFDELQLVKIFMGDKLKKYYFQ